jgi:transposase
MAMLPVEARPVVEVIVRIFEQQLAQRDAIISDLQSQIHHLQARLNEHSGNSSRPPSSDGPKKRPKKSKSTAKQRKGRVGGQSGHEGRTLKMVTPEQVDAIQDHYPSSCEQCGAGLDRVASQGYQRRQVFDIPPQKMEVTEHRSHAKQCSCCYHQSCGTFPNEASNHAVYGSNLRALVCYLMVYQMLPYERTAQLLKDTFGLSLSQGTLDNMLSDADDKLDGFVEQTRTLLQKSEVVGFDETVLRCENAQRYAHVARTDRHTLLHLGRRDYATMNDMGVLNHFEGIAVHDRYANYFAYECEHGLCNAHLLRDLQGAVDRSDDHQQGRWAVQLQDLLRAMKKAVERAIAAGKSSLSASHLAQYRRRYHYLVEQGLHHHPKRLPEQANAPPIKQSKTHNLLWALNRYADEVLRFLYDFDVPFDNNGAERDIRMLKVKMKISGFFHNISTGNRFVRIRSFVCTARKQGYTAFEALRQLFSVQAEEFVLNLARL